MVDEPGIRWKTDDEVTGPILDSVWKDAQQINIGFVRGRRGADI